MSVEDVRADGVSVLETGALKGGCQFGFLERVQTLTFETYSFDGLFKLPALRSQPCAAAGELRDQNFANLKEKKCFQP